ncbi:hypothetical protein T439DRAFT_144766 [Meredithblackwellia eburnea MCA 4105]
MSTPGPLSKYIKDYKKSKFSWHCRTCDEGSVRQVQKKSCAKENHDPQLLPPETIHCALNGFRGVHKDGRASEADCTDNSESGYGGLRLYKQHLINFHGIENDEKKNTKSQIHRVRMKEHGRTFHLPQVPLSPRPLPPGSAILLSQSLKLKRTRTNTSGTATSAIGIFQHGAGLLPTGKRTEKMMPTNRQSQSRGSCASLRASRVAPTIIKEDLKMSMPSKGTCSNVTHHKLQETPGPSGPGGPCKPLHQQHL